LYYDFFLLFMFTNVVVCGNKSHALT